MQFDFDLGPLFYLVWFGLICAAAVIVAGSIWLGWHLFQALSLYIVGVA